MFAKIFPSSKKSAPAQKAAQEPTGTKPGRRSTIDTADLSCEISEDHTPQKEESWKVEIASEFIKKWQEHDMAAAKKLATDDFVIVFDVSDTELDFDCFADEANKIFAAFPDFSFDYDWIMARKDGTVVLKDMRPRGHHTAQPYAYGPCEPIAATGKYIENAPETSTFYFNRDGKICKQVVHAKGDMTGPAGIYTQLGGFPMI